MSVEIKNASNAKLRLFRRPYPTINEDGEQSPRRAHAGRVQRPGSVNGPSWRNGVPNERYAPGFEADTLLIGQIGSIAEREAHSTTTIRLSDGQRGRSDIDQIDACSTRSSGACPDCRHGSRRDQVPSGLGARAGPPVDRVESFGPGLDDGKGRKGDNWP